MSTSQPPERRALKPDASFTTRGEPSDPPGPTGPSEGTAEALEQLRSSLALHIDAMGGWTAGGEPVAHPGVAALFVRGLDALPGGRHAVFVGPQWAYVDVADTPLRARAASIVAGGLQLWLDDGRTVTLVAPALVEDARGVRCFVPSQRSGSPLSCRLSNAATMAIAESITEGAGGEASLVIAGTRVVIDREAR